MTGPPDIIHATDDGRWFSRLAERSRTSTHAYRLIVAEERRTGEQNNKMWPLLAECAAQLKLHGRSFDKDQWKAIMLHAWGQVVEFLPTLDGSTFFPYGQQTSKLSKQEMSSFIEFILAEGTQRGVVFKDDPVNHVQTG